MGFGSKGKQLHKHTASKTQSHTQSSHQMQRKILKLLQSISDQALVPACPTLMSVYLALHGNKVLSVTTVTTESWTKNQDGIFFCVFLPLPGYVALPQNGLWKHSVGEAAADRSQGSHMWQWHVTCGRWEVTCDTWHMTWDLVGGEHSLKMSST